MGLGGGVMDVAAFERVYGSFREFHAFFAVAIGRKQWREHIRHYLQALLVQCQERRNAGNLSETVPASARAMQRFLTEARWDDDAVIGRLQEYLGPKLADSQAVWVFDGSDFPKQGVKSVGVARQYCGALGKIASCQAGVFLAHVGPRGRALADKRLYLPEEWTSDADRCAAAGVPADRREYRSKTELALEMLTQAQARGHLRAQWVAGDSAFGMSPSFRDGLAAAAMWYVLDVRPDMTVWPPEPAWNDPAYQGFGRPRKPKLLRGQRLTVEGRSLSLPEGAWREVTVAGGDRGGGDRGGGNAGAEDLYVQRPADTGNAEAKARGGGLGGLPPEPGRERAPLLPVQRPGGHTLGHAGLRGRVKMAH